jgi:hypothetical protein
VNRMGNATNKAAKKPGAREPNSGSPSRPKDAEFRDRLDWRGRTLERVRALIRQADPDVVEERKWKKPSNPDGVPVWSHDGMICTGETYKNHVRVTFARGAALEDPRRLFNSGLEGNARRAIDIREDDEINEEAFKALVRAAVVRNESVEG